MKKIILIAISLGLLILDNTILPYYSINGAFPSLLFVFAIAFSIINGKWDAIFIGIVSGFLQDIFFFQGFGVNMFVNMLLCLLAAEIGGNILKQNRIIPVISCFVISALKVLAVFLLFKIFGQNIKIGVSLLSAFFNMVVMLIVYKIILNTCEKYKSKKSWRFRW